MLPFRRLILTVLVLALGLFGVWFWHASKRPVKESSAIKTPSNAVVTEEVGVEEAGSDDGVIGLLNPGHRVSVVQERVRLVWPLELDRRLSGTERPAFVRDRFEREVPVVFAAFADWLVVYEAALPAVRETLLDHGMELVQARREAWAEFARADPEAALRLAPTREQRASLPTEMVALLEREVSGVGFYGVAAVCGHGVDDEHVAGCEIRHEVFINDTPYTALIYGARKERLTEENASIHGVAVDGLLVLHEDEIVVEAAPGAAQGGPFVVFYRGEAHAAATPGALDELLTRLLPQ